VLEQLKDPGAIKAMGAIAAVLLIFGWNYLPKSKAQDIKYYRALKLLQEEIRTKRNNPGELTALATKGKKIAKEIADDLKNKASTLEPAKQCLLWAARDEFPRACLAGFGTESPAEKMFGVRLQEAAYQLNLEPRPKIPASAMQNAPLPDD
jgi:hypothetical protein